MSSRPQIPQVQSTRGRIHHPRFRDAFRIYRLVRRGYGNAYAKEGRKPHRVALVFLGIASAINATVYRRAYFCQSVDGTMSAMLSLRRHWYARACSVTVGYALLVVVGLSIAEIRLLGVLWALMLVLCWRSMLAMALQAVSGRSRQHLPFAGDWVATDARGLSLWAELVRTGAIDAGAVTIARTDRLQTLYARFGFLPEGRSVGGKRLLVRPPLPDSDG